MTYYIGSMPFGGDDIQHFGVKGMKWGVRRYQNEDGTLTALGRSRYGEQGISSARQTARTLNKLDAEQTNARVRYEYHGRKAERGYAKLNKKLSKLEAGNPGDMKKALKLKKKAEKLDATHVKKATEYKDLLDRSKALSEKIISDATAKGYSVHSKEVLRSVNTGRNVAKTIIGTAAGMGLSAALKLPVQIGYITGQAATGNKYKVRNDGLGTRTHKSTSRRYRRA